MAKVLIRSVKRPTVKKRVNPRLARFLVARGWEYVDEPRTAVGQYGTANVAAKPPKPDEPADKPEGSDLDALSYAELRALAKERDIEPEGRTKADYVEALSNPGRYLRRDMRAEDE